MRNNRTGFSAGELKHPRPGRRPKDSDGIVHLQDPSGRRGEAGPKPRTPGGTRGSQVNDDQDELVRFALGQSFSLEGMGGNAGDRIGLRFLFCCADFPCIQVYQMHDIRARRPDSDPLAITSPLAKTSPRGDHDDLCLAACRFVSFASSSRRMPPRFCSIPARGPSVPVRQAAPELGTPFSDSWPSF